MFTWHCCLWGCAGSWGEAEGHRDWPAPPGSPQGHAAAQTRAEAQASQLREQCTLPSSGCFCFFREWWVWYPCGNKTAKSELSLLFFHNAAPFLRSPSADASRGHWLWVCFPPPATPSRPQPALPALQGTGFPWWSCPHRLPPPTNHGSP